MVVMRGVVMDVLFCIVYLFLWRGKVERMLLFGVVNCGFMLSFYVGFYVD